MIFQTRPKKEYYDGLFDNSAIKVVVVGCAAIISALIFMSISSIVITNNAVVLKLKNNDLGNLAQSIGQVIEGKIERAVDASIILSNDNTLKYWIEQNENDKSIGSFVRQNMEGLVNELGYDTCFVVNRNSGNYWSYSNGEFVLLDTVSSDDPSDKWFFSAIKMNRKYEINIDQNKELNDTFVWINALAGDISNPIAVAGIGMNLSSVINELINDESHKKIKNDIWMVDESGTIQLSKGHEFLHKQIQNVLPNILSQNILHNKNFNRDFVIDEYLSMDNQIYDIAYKNIKSTDWKFIVQIPRSESTNFLDSVTLNTVISCVIIIVLMVMMFYLLSLRIANPYKRALQINKELEKQVNQRTKELKDTNEKIIDSIEYAKVIQRTILPSDTELQKNLREHFLIFEPRDIVGGDFYWMKSYEMGFLLVVGDCTGHGVPGSLMTTAVNSMLNHIVDDICNNNPALILNELGRLMNETFRKQEVANLVSDGLDAAILFVSKSGEVMFAGANISLFVSDGENIYEKKGSIKTIDGSGRKSEENFENYNLDLSANNTFYIITDGFKDQLGGQKNLPFGKKQLVTLLRQVTNLDMNSQRDQILQALNLYQKNEARRDDITFLGFRL